MTRLTEEELARIGDALDEAGHSDLADKIYAQAAEPAPGRSGNRRAAVFPLAAIAGLCTGVGSALARGFRESA